MRRPQSVDSVSSGCPKVLQARLPSWWFAAPTYRFVSLWVSLFWTVCENGIVGAGSLTLSRTLLRFIHVVFIRVPSGLFSKEAFLVQNCSAGSLNWEDLTVVRRCRKLDLVLPISVPGSRMFNWDFQFHYHRITGSLLRMPTVLSAGLLWTRVLSLASCETGQPLSLCLWGDNCSLVMSYCVEGLRIVPWHSLPENIGNY